MFGFQVDLDDKECSKKTFIKNRDYYFSKTFKNKCWSQGSEPASRDISPNNNNNNGGNNMHSMHQKQANMNKPRNWYKPHRRYPKMSQQPQNSTPQHKRKKQVKQHPSQKLEND